MNIKAGAKYPAGALSNFSPYRFTVDGVDCNSMEGWLQSLKFKPPETQKYVCTLVGGAAKVKGAAKNWKKRQVLYWKGVEYQRSSEDYQLLLDKAFKCLSKNVKFMKALISTREANLTHSIGKRKKQDTVLTQKEFCSRLLKLRGGLL